MSQEFGNISLPSCPVISLLSPTLARGRGHVWRLDSGQWTVDSGQWTVDSGQWTVDSGQWTVDSGQCWTVDSAADPQGDN
jgi:hypothetical protein